MKKIHEQRTISVNGANRKSLREQVPSTLAEHVAEGTEVTVFISDAGAGACVESGGKYHVALHGAESAETIESQNCLRAISSFINAEAK